MRQHNRIRTWKLLTSQFTIQVDQHQVDITYDYNHQIITIHVDTILEVQYHYTPASSTFNLVNLADIALRYVEAFERKHTNNYI